MAPAALLPDPVPATRPFPVKDSVRSEVADVTDLSSNSTPYLSLNGYQKLDTAVNTTTTTGSGTNGFANRSRHHRPVRSYAPVAICGITLRLTGEV